MKATLCENPFDLTRDHRLLEIRQGETIGQLVVRAQLVTESARTYVVSCNGELLPPETALEYVPQPNDDIALVPYLHNQALRTIAVIGVSIAAAYFAGPLGGIIAHTFGIAANTATAIAGALISVAGNLLVAGIASFFQKTPGGSNYGVLGPSTTARSGIVIPKGYGLMRRAGNIVESWVDIQGNNQDAHDVDDGADTIGRQYINARIDFGWGPARSFQNILLNGKDIGDYSDIAYVLLNGTNDQAPVAADDPRWVTMNLTTTGDTINTQPTTDFNTINNNFPRAQRVKPGTPIVVAGQRPDTQKLTVFVNFPLGVWRLDDSNIIKRAAIDYDVYYRVAGSGDAGWILAQHHYYYNIRQTNLRQATIIDGLAAGRYDVKVVKNGSGAKDNPIDTFEHESNKWGDQLWIESVQETSYTALAYPGKIQMCLRYMATDQLSGSDMNVSADIVHGLRSTLPAQLAAYGEDNPACVAYDIFTDPIIGGGIPDDPTRKDLDFFAEWAEFADTLVDDGDGGHVKLSVFNGAFDQDNVSVWAAACSVSSMSRTNLQRVGTRVTGWFEKEDVQVQTFHVGNILLNSYTCKWQNLDDRAQQISVTFADAEDDYRTRNPVRVTRTADLNATDSRKKQNVNLLGCTSKVQAYYWATQQLLENELTKRTHTWRSNAQAIRCRTGNIVGLQIDRPNDPFGGLTAPGSTATQVILDRTDIPAFDPTQNFTLSVIHPALERGAINITAVFDGSVLVAGYDGSPITRLQQGDVDVAVRRVDGNVLYIDSSAGITAGAGAVWDLDVYETRSVTAIDHVDVRGQIMPRISVATPYSVVPVDYAGYIFQSNERVLQLVRVRNIRKAIGEQRFTITGFDYNTGSYDIPAPVGLGG
jgi:hypothetical protein